MDDFVDRLYVEITSLPDIEDDVKCEIKLPYILNEVNVKVINAEIERFYELLC